MAYSGEKNLNSTFAALRPLSDFGMVRREFEAAIAFGG
jgi:hypothetical protein